MASKNEGENKARAVLEILSNNGQLSGQDIANQCSFESRMASAGVIAQLVRTKAIEAVPASYRITETGRSIPASSTTTPEDEQPKRSKRKSKKEPQDEPSSGQGEQSP